MVLAGRPTRRRGGTWLLAIGIAITLVIVLVDASLKSRTDNSAQRLSAQAWVDQVLPLIRNSTAEGQQLDEVRTNWQPLAAPSIASQLKQTASSAAASYEQVLKLIPPADYGQAGGLLDACLLLRKEGSSAVANTVISSLSGPSPPAPGESTALATAGQKLELGDQLYQQFANSLGGLGVKMPTSTWVRDGTLYQSQTLSAYLTALRSKTNLQPTHQVVIESFTTTPQPETVVNQVQMIPYSRTMTVGVVVANTGNQVEQNVTLTAGVLPAVKQPTVRRSLGTMKPGDPVSISLGPLYALRGKPTTLTLTISGQSPLPASTRAITFEMPPANSAPKAGPTA
jgi:hypothetical protein